MIWALYARKYAYASIALMLSGLRMINRNTFSSAGERKSIGFAGSRSEWNLSSPGKTCLSVLAHNYTVLSQHFLLFLLFHVMFLREHAWSLRNIHAKWNVHYIFQNSKIYIWQYTKLSRRICPQTQILTMLHLHHFAVCPSFKLRKTSRAYQNDGLGRDSPGRVYVGPV